ncbi:lymphocyte activation gene 3 [Pelobates cultripes]|uniref:Lymphocyte activation gene 3 n=1 Tax=Pelobates cultripes TaxID=61616 RepID=A0AAD1TBX9_PELCU|nr:lymphocyte activation gene 3 [Pelobates cultripes]
MKVSLGLICILCLSALCAGSHVVVTGVIGDRVTLPCLMSPEQLNQKSNSKYPAVSLHWRRINREPVNVVSVYPSGIMYTNLPLISRASVRKPMLDSGDFSLHLLNVRKTDAGNYVGLAVYGRVKKNCTVELRTIEVTQSPPGLVPENGSVTLNCSTESPNMKTIRWFHRGIPINPTSRYVQSGHTLRLIGLTQAERGNWSCEVKGVRATLTLQVLGILGSKSLTVYAGVSSRAELPCAVTSIPKDEHLAVHWLKVPNTNIRDAQGQTLVFNDVSTWNAGKYRCDVTYKGHTLSRWIDLKVIQVIRVLPSDSRFIREGSNLQIECKVHESQLEEQYEWTGPSTDSGHREVQRGAVLNLPSVQTEDAGVWNCTVYGKKGIVGKSHYMLYVHASQTGIRTASSWQMYVILLLSFLLVLGIATIAGLSVQNRRRRLLNLAALTSMDRPCVPAKKSLSL